MFKYVIGVFFSSMIPVLELRFGIPFGAANGVPIWGCFLAAVIGNLIPVPFLLMFGGKVLRRLARFEKFGAPFRKILSVGEKKAAKLNARKSLFWGLFAFVAIPLPGTGAWTGSLVSLVLGLDYKKCLPPIIFGVLVAGTVMTLGAYGVVGIFKVFS